VMFGQPIAVIPEDFDALGKFNGLPDGIGRCAPFADWRLV